MASKNTAVLARIKRSGMGIIAPAAGLAALHAILFRTSSHVLFRPASSSAAAVIANPFDWPQLLRDARPLPAVFAEHAPVAAAAVVPAKRQKAPMTVVVQTSDVVLSHIQSIVHGMLGPEVLCSSSVLAPVMPEQHYVLCLRAIRLCSQTMHS